MLTQVAIGVVKVLNGVLEKVNVQGEVRIIKAGAALHHGDRITLLSGEAHIQLNDEPPKELVVSKPYVLDEQSVVLNSGLLRSNSAHSQDILANDLHSSVVTKKLIAASMYVDETEKAKVPFYLDVMNGSKLILPNNNTFLPTFEELRDLRSNPTPQAIVFKPVTDDNASLVISNINIPSSVISGIFKGEVTESSGLNNSIPGVMKFEAQITSINGFTPKNISGTLGTFSLDASGKWSYQLHHNSPLVDALRAGETQILTFDAVATDGTKQQITLTVHGKNDAPNSVSETNTGFEDTALTGNVLTNDRDPEGDPIRVSLFRIDGDPAQYQAGQTAVIQGRGQITILANGNYIFTPQLNYSGPVPNITYFVSDGTMEQSAVLSLQVGLVNDAPAGTNKNVSTLEDTPLVIKAVDFGFTDPDDSSANAFLAVKINTLPVDGTLYLNGMMVTSGQTISIAAINSNLLVYVPTANSNGSAHFTFQVQDSGGTLNGGNDLDPTSNTLTINVAPVDDAFSDANEVVSTAEDTILYGSVLTGTSSVDGTVNVTQFSVAGDPAIYSAGQTAIISGIGTIQINTNGAFSFIPAANYNGSVPVITYTLSDGSSSDSSTLSINVTPVDDAFTDANEVMITDEDTTLNGNVLTGTNSVDGAVSVTQFNVAGDPVTYAAGNTAIIAGVGSLRIDANGTFSFIPAPDYNGTVPLVTYTLSDGSSSDTSTLSIDVTPVVDPFSDADEFLNTAEDTTLNGNVLTGTSSVGGTVNVTQFTISGDPATYAAGDTAAISGIGSLRIDANGTFSFVPAANYNGSVPLITYTLSDGSSGNISTLTIDVTSVDDAFSDTNEVLTTAEDTTLNGNVLTGTSSVDGAVTVVQFTVAGDPATYNAGDTATIAGIGTLQINTNGTFSFVPAANYNGAVPVATYTLSDGSSSDTSTLSLDVTAVDDAFSDADEVLSTAEDTTLNGNVLTGTSSVDGAVTVTQFTVAGDPATYNAGDTATIAGVGTLQINANGTFSFVPAANYNGAVPVVTYTMTDGSSTDTSTLSIDVTAVDDAFSDANEVLSTAEDTTLNGNVLTGTSSVDGAVSVTQFSVAGDPATYNAGDTATIAGVGTLQINANGTFSFVPVANYNGAVPVVTYTMTDGSSNDTSTLSLDVTAVDDAFSDADEVVSTAEDTTLNGNVLTGTSSVDGAVSVTEFSVAGDPATYNAGDTATIAGVGTLQINANGAFSFIPVANYNGSVPVATYTLSDGSSTDTSTLSIDVTAVDDAFSDANEVVSTAEDTTLNGNVLTGTSSVDGAVTVTQFTVAGDPATYNAGDTATIAGVGILQINANGTFSFVPAANYNGAVPVATYTLSDGSSTDTSTLSIDVTAVDDAFSDANEILSTAEDTTLNGNVLTGTSSLDGAVSVTEFSVAGDPATYNAGDTATIAGVGTLQINANGTFSFVPAANYNGAVPVVTYTMTDGSSTDTSTLSLDVTLVDDAFSDADEVVSTAEDTTLNGNVLTGTSSVDGAVSVTEFSVAGDPATYNAGDTATIAGVGTLRIDANGAFSFVPAANYIGAVPVATYTLSDGSSSDTSTLSIDVTAVDDAFSDADEVLSTAEDTTLNGNVLTGTSSVDGAVSVTQFTVAGDPATYNAGDTATIAGVGTLQINANGAFSFVPAANYNGAVPVVTYTMTDGSSTDTSTLSLDVTPVDDAFSDADEVVSTAEDTTLNGNVLTGTSSVDGAVSVTQFTVAGDPATYNAGDTATIAGVGTLQINANGAFSFVPAANYNGAVPVVTYTMTDGSSTDTSTLSIDVTAVDDAFSDANEVLSTAEDTTLNGNVLTGTSSVDGAVSVTEFSVAGDPATYYAGDTATIAGVGTLRIDANGAFSFVPAANYNGAVPVATYTLSDGSSSDTSTLSIDVTAVDDAFSDADEVLSTAEDTTLNGNVLTGTSSVDGAVSVTEFSVAGDPATYNAGDTATIAGVGTLQINANGTFSFVPAANYNGAVPVATYTLSDGSSSDTSTLSIDVTAVDDVFSDANEVLSTAEDTTLNGNVLTGTSSVDGAVTVTQFTVAGDPATYNAGDTATIAGVGTLQINANGTFSFVPAANYNGAVPVVTYTMTDGSSTDTSTLSLDVTLVDDAFSDADEVVSTAEDTTLNGNVLTGTSSVDGAVIVTEFSVAGDPATYNAGDTATIAGVGTLRIDANGAFSFVPAANYIGAVPVATYTLSDGSSSDTSTLSIDVTAVDDVFSDANEVLSTAEDTTLNGNVLTGTSSVDGAVSVTEFSVAGDPATYNAGDTATIAGVGTLQINANGTFSFVPAANYNGAVPVVTYTMTDGSSSDTSTLSIDVTPVDDAFSDANEVVSTAEDTTLNGNVLTGTSSVDGAVTVTQFSVSGDPATYNAGDTATIAGIGTLRIDANGAFSFIPEANYNGAVPVVTYTLSDGSSTDTSTLSIDVTAVDDAFSDADEVLSTAEDTTLNGNVLTGTSSVDGAVTVTQFTVAGDPATYNAGDTATIAGIGTLQINANGAFSFVPAANYNGAVPVATYTMTDGSSSDTSTLSIDVTPVDDAFSDANEVVSTAEDTTLNGNVLTGTSSVDGAVSVTEFSVAGDPATYNVGDTATIAGVGTLQINANGAFSFIPEANYNGAVPVATYTLSDGSSSDTSTLSIDVTAVDDAFSDADEVLSTAEDTTLNGNVLTGTSSVDGAVSVTEFSVAGDPATYNAGDTATIAGIGTLRIDANGAFSFVPAANYNGAVPVVTYTMTDGSSTDTSTLSLDVTAVDDAFSDADEVVSTAEDTTLNGNVLTGTSSVDGAVSVTEFSVAGDPATYNAGDTATIAGVGTLQINANGTFSFIPVANYNGAVPVATYTLSDGSSTDTSTLSIDVTAVDDAFSDADEVLSTAEDTTLNGNVLTGTSSVDGAVTVTQFTVAGDPATYNAGDTATIAGIGTLQINANGTFNFVPAANYNGAVPVATYTLSDGSSTDTSTLSIDVTAVDDAFSDANEVLSTAEDTTLNGNVLTGTSSVDGAVSVTQFSVVGDPATYNAGDTATIAGIGTLRIDANGAFSFIPVANYNGAVPVATYTLSDGSSTDTSTLSIDVTAVDDAFSDADEVLSTAEDTTLNGNVLTGTTSVDGAVSVTQFSVAGDPATYNAGDTATIAGVGAIQINANGALSFVPAANYNGAVPVVTYTMTDGSSTDTSTLSIDVTAVDDVFSDANEVVSTAEETTLNGNVLTGTSSVDGAVSVTEFSVAGDPATYSAGDTATIAGVGTLQINANGTFSFVPAANYNGAVPVVTYTMTDGSSNDTSTLSLDVTPVDDAFSDADEVLSTAEDTTLNGNVLTGTSSVDGAVSVTEFSVAGDPATYNAGDTATIAGVGTLQINANGTFSFVPAANYNGAVPVATYTLSDGSSSDTSTLSIDVTAVDDVFSDANEVLSTAEDTTLNGNVLTGTSSVDGAVSVTEFSVAGDPATYNAGDTATIAGVGTLQINANGTFSFVPAANYNGAVPVVTYTMTDGSSSDTSTLSIDVTPVDDAFSDANEVVSTAEDTTLNGNVLTGTSSVDGAVSVTEFSVAGDPATYNAGDTATIAGIGTLRIDANGAFSFIPEANYNGAVPVVTYTLSDGSSTDTSTLSIDVTAVDDAFSDADEVLSTAEDTTLNGNVLTGTSSVDGAVTVTQFTVAGDPATYNAGDTATIAGIGTLQINANGAFSFVPAANYNGAVPVATYTLSDGSSTDTSTLSIDVTAVDDAFSDADEVLSTAEDTTLNGNVLTGTSSVDGAVTVTQFSVSGDPATYNAGDTATIAGVGTLQINANGTFNFVPAANYNGAVPVATYTLSDGSSSDTSTLSIDVTAVDDAFSDADEVLSTAEDTTLNGNVLTGTSSVDGAVSVTEFSVAGDPATYNAGDTATIAGVGTLQINANGTFSFVPAANYNGAVPVVTYTMTDGSSSDTSTLSIDVTPVDDAFSDADEVLSTAEDTTLNGNVLTGTSSVDGAVSVTEFSVAGDPATYNAGDTATIAGVGTLQINANGTFNFVPAANYNGAVPVATYTLSDGSSTDTSTLSIDVTPVDDAFSDADEVLSTAEDTTLNGNVLTGTSSVDGAVSVTEFSVAGDPATYNAGDTATIAGIGTLRIDANGAFSFVPAANYNGAVPVATYTLSDGSSSDTSTLSIDVTAVDDAFSDADEVLSTAEDTTLNGNVLTGTSSVDGAVSVTEFSVAGDPATYNAGDTATIAGVGTLQINANGTFSFVPAANYNGAVPVATYTLSDGSSTDTSTLSIDVTAVDDAFSDADEVLSTAEDTTLNGNVLTGTTSVDGAVSVTEFSVAGDPATYNAGDTATIAGVGTLQINANGAFSFIPVANYNGAVPVVTYTMTDGSSSDTSTLSIDVTAVDDAFSDADEVLSTAEDTTLNGNVLTGTSSVDGAVNVTEFSVAGDPATYNAGDTATIAGVGTLQINANGTFSFVPAANYNGAVPVATYTLSDGSSSDTSTLSIDVTAVDDAFSDANEILSTAEDTTLNGNVLTGTSSVDGAVSVTEFSVAGDPATYLAGDTAVIAGVGSLLINADGAFSFVPAANYNGAVPVVTYTMTDGSSSDTSTLSLDVTAVDDAFSDNNEVLSTVEDTPLNGTVLSGTSSVDGSVTVTQFSVAGDPATYLAGDTAVIAGIGSLQINADGTFSFTPDANYNGAVPVVTYTLTDGSSTDTSTLSLDVTPVNDPLVDSNEVLSTPEDTPLNGTVLSGTSSPEGAVIVTQFSVAGDLATYLAGDTAIITGIGSLQINADGTFSFTPNANYNGAVPLVTYSLTDGSTSDTSTLSLDVTAVDDAFTDNNEVLSIVEDAPPLNGTVLSGTSSVDGPVNVTQFSVAGDPATYLAGDTAVIAGVGSLLINADGTFIFTPNANYNGTVPLVTYTLSDGSSTDTSTLALDVTPVDDSFSDSNEVLNTAEDTPLNGTVLSGTSSVDGPVTVTEFSVAGDPATYVAGDTAILSGVGTLQINTDGTFSFIPNSNYNGAVPLVTYTLSDGSNTDVSTLTISLTAVNDAPIITGQLNQTMVEDGSRNFRIANSNEFTLSDTDSASVTITISVLYGNLTVSDSIATTQGIAVSNNGSMSITLVGAPANMTTLLESLNYTPVKDYYGQDTLTFTANDGVSSSTHVTLINITAGVDIADDTAVTNEDTAVNIAVIANDTFENAGRVITAINGNAITVGGTVNVADGTVLLNANGTVTFTPANNFNGSTSFTYTVTSGGATETATVNVTVNPVSDAPQGSDYTLSATEDTPIVLSTAHFSMTDVNDNPANSLLRVRIATLPTSGTLTLNGVAVTAGQNIDATDINAGLLVFTPVKDAHGASTFTFQVSDDGGTANGGVNLDQTPNLFTIDVGAVADTPLVYAHLSLPTITAGTNVIDANFSDNINENNLTNWTRVALFTNTFAEIQGGSGKSQTEANLFTSSAWAGQTGTDATEVSNFNSRWTKSGGEIFYNSANANDDSQGILFLNTNQMTVAERALTSYVISVDVFANINTSVNGVGVVFGYQNSSNYFLVRWENPDINFAPGGSSFQFLPGQYYELSLVQIVAGTPTDLARTTFNGDDWFNLVINVSATGISIAATDLTDPATQASLSYVYGTVSGGASTAPALTTVGMYTFDSDFASRWDNLTVNQAASFQYILQTEAFLSDLDGSETLGTITLSSIPNGVTLFDTVTNTEVVVTSGSANVIVGNDIRLTSTTVLTAAQISAITATASSVESSNGNTATSQSIPVYLEITGNSPAETITGTASSDWITGDSGNDILSGGNGSDVIIGGLGNDTITTGSGSDQIVLLKGQGGATAGAAPTDIITDFTVNTDTIVIKGTNIIGVSVSTPSSNIYTITVTYSGAATEYFKVNLSNGAVLNDSGDTQLTGVVLSGGTATIDGTIVGAILYLDINNNNQEDEGERLGITDQYGHVEWVLDLAKLDVNGDGQYVLGEARAVQTGGFDIDTGLTYEINLFGPVGSAIVSPLTSLLQAQLESGFDYQTANANIVARLGLPEGTELISLNPIMGSHDILMQNASVMTAAVQFAELAAIRYSTDEGRVSFSVFEAISKALLELPEGVIADFSDTNLLNSIASYLDLGELASAEVIDFLAASQRALHVSMETLAPGDNALAAISEVQHLTQGSYAQILESYSRGYLPSHILSDISVIVLAFSSSSISYDALRDFNDQFTAVVNQSSTYYSEYSADGTQDNGTSNFVQQLDTVVHDFMTAHGLDAAQVNDFYVYTLLDLGLETENVLFPDISQSNDNTTQYSSSSTGTEELYGSANNDFIYGGYGNELIFGGDGDDFLHGGAGDDTIVGGLGNDIIHGGMGNDLMTGGGGNDVFVFEKSDIGSQPGIDTITDFKLGIEETINGEKSILDLTDLFKDSTLTSNSLDSLLQISTILNESTNQTDTVIKTDPTGNALFNASPETIVLSGVDVVSVFGTSDSAELVQHMLAANVLVMGH